MTDFTELDEKKPYGYIYKIDFPNDKVYIGLTTTSLKQRKKEHKKNAKAGDTKCLYNALRKYNMVDTFELIEIDTADTHEELSEKEIMYIFEYNSYNENGYNMTYGGGGVNGYHHTEETRQKAREKAIQQFKNPEAREKLKESQKQRWKNPEAREKMSEAKKNYFKNNPNAGKEHGEKMKAHYENNEEARERAREKSIQQFKNPEAREKMSELIKNYFKNNPETRKKMSELKKNYYKNNPEARKKNSEARKKHYENNPEVKKNRLDTMGKNKPFDVFTRHGTFIKTFTYQMDAREYLKKEYNITSTILIDKVLNGKRKSCAGFVFKYKD